jgi:hypothetical protein
LFAFLVPVGGGVDRIFSRIGAQAEESHRGPLVIISTIGAHGGLGNLPAVLQDPKSRGIFYPGNSAIRAKPQIMATRGALGVILYHQYFTVGKQSQWQGPMGEPRFLEVDASSTGRLYPPRKFITDILPPAKLLNNSKKLSI